MEDESQAPNYDSSAVAFQKEMKTPNLSSFKERSEVVHIWGNNHIAYWQRASRSPLQSPVAATCVAEEPEAWPTSVGILTDRHLQECQLNKYVDSLYPCCAQEHFIHSSSLEGRWQCCLGGSAAVGEFPILWRQQLGSFPSSEGSTCSSTQEGSKSCSGSFTSHRSAQVCPGLPQDNSWAHWEPRQAEETVGRCKEHLEPL